MKKIFDFLYCDSILDASTVLYHVRVGTSKKDTLARRYVESIAKKSNAYLFARHDGKMAEFMTKVADSIFASVITGDRPKVMLMRHKYVEITQLARFLKTCPPQLLNTENFSTPVNP